MAKIIISNWDKLPVAVDLQTCALIFDVSDVTIKHWLYAGVIEGTKLGNKWFFDKDYLRTVISKGDMNNDRH